MYMFGSSVSTWPANRADRKPSFESLTLPDLSGTESGIKMSAKASAQSPRNDNLEQRDQLRGPQDVDMEIHILSSERHKESMDPGAPKGSPKDAQSEPQGPAK